MFDLVIHGAAVIDGTGQPRRKLDVGVRGDRIARIGQIDPAESHRAIDATGLILAPGFIDVHNHSEGWLLKTGWLPPKISQGFTTEVLMSDGISYAPITEENYRDWFLYLRGLNGLEMSDYTGWRSIADYMELLNGRTAQNVATLIPFGNLRVLAAGWGRKPLDDTQIRMVRNQVIEAMEAGAVGMSTGLDYVAQFACSTDEIAEVCSAMAPWGGLYVTHIRYKKGTLGGVKEAVEIGRRAGVPVHISHLKGFSQQETDEILSYIDNVATKEVDFSFDIYPYIPGSTMLNFILPYEVWDDGPLAVCAKLRDPDVRRRFQTLLDGFGTPLDLIRISTVATKANSKYHGMSLADYAAQTGRSAADAVCDLLIEENLTATAVLYRGEDVWVEPMLQHPKFMLGSDGIYADGVIHPRMYGSAPKILGPMVRDKRLFSLEEAVRKMTGYSAERWKLNDRGVIREGAFADLVVFNADTIADRATYEDPHQLSVGIEHVVVNGKSIWADGQGVDLSAGEMPGQALRFGQ